MRDALARQERLIGKEKTAFLKTRTVAVFGLGGVGSYAVEGLARAGIGRFIFFDHDKITVSNLNRQLFALNSTVGQDKVAVAEARIKDICSDTQVETHPVFVDRETIDRICLDDVHYIVDAVDTVTAKLLIIERAKQMNIPVISCMGTGNKLDPARFRVSDISETSVCPLARVMRRELTKRKLFNIPVVWSDEFPIQAENGPDNLTNKKPVPGSISFVPPVAGMILAGEVIRGLLEIKRD